MMVYTITQYDQWFSSGSAVSFGVFVDKTEDEVIKIMMDGFEKLYPGFKKDVYENGSGQWLTDKFDFGVAIKELSVNVFEEQ